MVLINNIVVHKKNCLFLLRWLNGPWNFRKGWIVFVFIKCFVGHCSVGQLSSALWLAEYLKRETETLRPLPWCDAVSRRDETKTIKPIINEVFVASSGDIITDYNDLYCLFTRRVASHSINITMSAFVIGERTNNKHYSTLLKISVWIVSGKFFKYENILTVCESDAQDKRKVGIAPLYRNSLCAQLSL